jgi:FkbM family methyltransferase
VRQASAAETAGKAAAAQGSSANPAAGGADIGNGSGVGHSLAAAPNPTRGGVLVDVGAGQGFFSLAAAARGHRVIAFEASPPSLAAFKASVSYNGFHDLITVHSAALGAKAGTVCLQQAERLGCPGSAAAFKVAAAASIHANASRGGSNSSSMQQDQRELQAAVAAMQLRQRRGYSWVADGPPVSNSHSCCITAGSRLHLSYVLQNTTDVAALRISAHGHEGFILKGGLDYLRRVHKPDVIYVEFWPAAMRAAGDAKPVALMQALFDLGYTDIAHAGRVCDARWQNATQGLHSQVGCGRDSQACLAQQQRVVGLWAVQ